MARPLCNLGRLYLEQGKYEQAESFCLRAVRLAEQACGPEHPDVATMLENLATLYSEWDKYEQARPLYQQALSISEQAFGLEHHRVAESLHGLALLYQREGNGEQAEALFQRTLQIREQHLGRDHPETAHALHDLALLWQQQRRFHEALLLAERALQIQEQALGAAHPKTIDTQVLSTQLVQAHARAEEEKAVSRQETDRSAVHAKSVVVRGTIEQIAYTRTVKMREVTFTCTICSRTVTQLHYPSGRIKYCSQACRAVRGAQIQEQRVAKQREKRRSESEAHRRAQQQDGL